MTYTIIGTGNMAWFLAERLNKAGFKCRGVYGRNREEAYRLAQTIRAPIITDLHEIQDTTDLCLIAIADQAIGDVARRLSFRNTVVVHTAGSVPLSALSASSHHGVVWFIYSILKQDLPQSREIPCLWEGNSERAKEVVQQVAKAATDIHFEAGSKQRQWIHLTAVFGNNFINHLMAICEAICKEQDLPFSLLQPILHQTFTRVENTSPAEAQTGPARRHDQLTINQHLKLLNDHPEWASVYQALTNSIRNLYCPEP